MTHQLQLGLAVKNFAPSDEPLRFDELSKFARRAEDLGFASLFAWDHLFLGTRTYFPFLESLTVLGALAVDTERIRLGTGILVLPLRDPTLLAKVTITIDHISQGRFVLGAGAGWYEKEFDAVGTPFKGRGKTFERNLEILLRLWSEQAVDASYGGASDGLPALRFRRVVVEPKAVQRPRPPILLGGYADIVLRRIVKYADGWLTYLYRPESFAKSWTKLGQFAEAAGRDPAALRNVSQVPICVSDTYSEANQRVMTYIRRYFDVPPWSEASEESAIRGTADECAEQIAEHLEAGVQELVLMPCDYRQEQVEAIGKDILPRFAAKPEAGVAANDHELR